MRVAQASRLRHGTRRAIARRYATAAQAKSVYARDYAAAKHEPFWAEAAERILWTKKPSIILDKSSAPFYHWYKDGTLNTCYNALDRHVSAGYGDRDAFIYESPITGAEPLHLSYGTTLDKVSRLATVLQEMGVKRGDRVVIYMPMVPEAAISMLACARLGAVHSVVFGGFAPDELAARVRHARPKVLITASCGVEPGERVIPYAELVQRALDGCSPDVRPAHTILLQRSVGPKVDFARGGLFQDFNSLLAHERRQAPPTPVSSTDPLYVLYTSGTTGAPKGVVRDNGGHAVALSLSMERIFGINAGDVWWAASDLGWVVGHSYIVYGPLLRGATSVLFEGKPVGTPDAGTFWRIAARHRVKALFCAPTALRAIKKEDHEGKHLTSFLPALRASLRRMYVAGERADPPSLEWAHRLLGMRPLDNYWQTETGWPILSSYYGLDDAPSYVSPLGTAGQPMPGFDLHILDPALDAPVPDGHMGALVAKLPLPPGCLTSLYEDDAGFVRKYLDASKQFYITGDAALRRPDGSVEVLARTDDVINVAGHRLSTGRLEEVATKHPRVAEACAVGVADELKGHVPMLIVTLKGSTEVAADATKVEQELIDEVRTHVGAIASPRHVLVVPRLPKTRSGKILRGMLRSMVAGVAYKINSAEDPTVIAELRTLLQSKLKIESRAPET